MANESPQLTAAIEQWVRETAVQDGLILVDYVLVAAVKGFNEDGDQITAVQIQPHGAAYALRGLLDEALVRFHADLLERYREG